MSHKMRTNVVAVTLVPSVFFDKVITTAILPEVPRIPESYLAIPPTGKQEAIILAETHLI
jgi:hypothetical protein